MTFSRYVQQYRDQAAVEHEAILALVRSRSAKPAGRAMREHLEHCARHIASLIEQNRNSESAAAAPRR